MTEQEVFASLAGAALSLIVQVGKRWFSPTVNQIKLLIVVVAVVYGCAVGIIAPAGNIYTNIAAFVMGNQALFALILNQTSIGNRIANP